MDRVWSGLTVEENNIQVQISTLRPRLAANVMHFARAVVFTIDRDLFRVRG